MSALPEMTFVYRKGKLVGVRCDCGWAAYGSGGASLAGMAWGQHANEAHPLAEPVTPSPTEAE
jgi:hypothetical protein